MGIWNCYIDESATARALRLANEPNVPPVYVIAGVALAEATLRGVTSEFVDLKRHYYPGLDPGQEGCSIGCCRRSRAQTSARR